MYLCFGDSELSCFFGLLAACPIPFWSCLPPQTAYLFPTYILPFRLVKHSLLSYYSHLLILLRGLHKFATVLPWIMRLRTARRAHENSVHNGKSDVLYSRRDRTGILIFVHPCHTSSACLSPGDKKGIVRASVSQAASSGSPRGKISNVYLTFTCLRLTLGPQSLWAYTLLHLI